MGDRLLLYIQKSFLGFEVCTGSGDIELTIERSPIFIVGAPRSGSTFLYQSLVQSFGLGYISNLMALFPTYMSLASRFSVASGGISKGIQNSRYGYVSGVGGPSEAGAVMRLWFENELMPEERLSVRSTVARISENFRAPMVFKNLNNSLRVDNIASVFPEARFILLKRSPCFIAQSIYLARRRLGLNEDEWWSVAPEGYMSLRGKSLAQQVAWQAVSVEGIASRALSNASSFHITISYEDLVLDPVGVTSELRDKLNIPSLKDSYEIVSSVLCRPNEVKLPKSTMREIQRWVDFYKEQF